MLTLSFSLHLIARELIQDQTWFNTKIVYILCMWLGQGDWRDTMIGFHFVVIYKSISQISYELYFACYNFTGVLLIFSTSEQT